MHGCPILSQPEGTECAPQRSAIYRFDFPRIAAGKTVFLHLGPSAEVSSSGGRTDNSIHRAWQALGIIILIPARDATQRRGAVTTRQEAGLGARGVTKTTTGTRTSKPQDSDPQAHKQPTRRHNRCKPDGRKHGHTAHHPHPWQAQPAATIGPYAPCNQIHTATTTWPGKIYAEKAQAPGPAGRYYPFAEGHEQARSEHKEKPDNTQATSTDQYTHSTLLKSSNRPMATADQYTHSTLLKSSNRPMASARRRQGQQIYA